MHPDRSLRPVATYLGVAFASVIAVALAFPGADGPAPLLSVLCPAGAVLAVTLLCFARGARRPVWRTMGWHWGARWWPAGIGLAVLAIGVPYAAAAPLGLVHLGHAGSVLPDAALTLVVFSGVFLGEEVGWRGFLLPRLRTRFGHRTGAWLTGLLQGLFHVPILVLTKSYDAAGPRWFVVPAVVAVLTAAGPVFAWMRDRSGSIVAVAVFHCAVNAVLDVFETGGRSDHPAALAAVAGESGLVTLALVLVLAFALPAPRGPRSTPTPAAALAASA